MTVIEKILAAHADSASVSPGDIVEVNIDARVARDFGGANVVQLMENHNLDLDDPEKTFFTFDCNPTGSDQNYAANQHRCRQYARERGIRVYDIDKGIGTHVLIEEGLAYPGSTAISTDSHANILGAVGAFGQGMGDKDVAVSWHKGSTWFKVPPSAKLVFEGQLKSELSAKDISLNLLELFGAHTWLGYTIEMVGSMIDNLTLDQRITMASMATEMGAIIMLFPPNLEVVRYCESRSRKKITPVTADTGAAYDRIQHVDVSGFVPRISLPGKPHNTSSLPEDKIWIDSAFIGSCTNGRIEDLRTAAGILKGKRVADGVVLKIVPATDRVWLQCLEENLMEIFKESGALVSNAGCAGCAAGQVGQNGPDEVSVSTGNRNFPGKQGQGEVYLASPAIVAASSIAGFITDPDRIPHIQEKRRLRRQDEKRSETAAHKSSTHPNEIGGRVWFISKDNVDTDMIFHNRYLSITKIDEMGQYTFDHLKGYEDFASKAKPGDIVVTGKNFGSGSSRQQAVDCFVSLGIQCVVAESFGAIYERNAINAAFPIVTSAQIEDLQLSNGDELFINFKSGEMHNQSKNTRVRSTPFSEVQMEIYRNNGLF